MDNGDSEFKIGNFELTGWNAVIAIIALVFFIFLLGVTTGVGLMLP